MTSAEALALFNDLTGRPATDVILDAKKYTWLSRGEERVVSHVARVRPEILYQKVATSSLPTMVTTDNNVFTFGVDGDNNPIVPYGSVQIYPSLTSIPDRPWIPDIDYLLEGDQIRLPRNRKSAITLYWRGIVMPPPITADEAPHLIPSGANELTAIQAAMSFAAGGNIRNAALVKEMRIQWAERFPIHCSVWKRQFSRGGALRSYSMKDILTPL